MPRITYEERISRGFAKIDADLQILIECLGDMLEETGAGDVAASLPWFRKDRGWPSEFGQQHAQAYSIALQLLNMVEENTAAHMRRVVESANGIGYETALWGRRLRELRQAGWTGERLAEVLRLTQVEPVLTAHPTESKRVTIIRRHRELYRALRRHGSQDWTDLEHARSEGEIRTLVELLWRTGEIVIQKPTVDAERAAQLHYFETVFPDSLSLVDERLHAAWKATGFDPKLIEDPTKLPRLRFGTWVGGDRDGHPLVTADVTRRTLGELRAGALRLHARALHTLRATLSLSDLLQPVPVQLTELLAKVSARLPAARAEAVRARNPNEPWRQAVSLILECLPGTTPNPGLRSYPCAGELVEDLRLLRESLVASGARRIALERVDPVIRNVDCFGFHLAALDIRQNSTTHERAVEQILKAAGLADWQYSQWDEAQRRAFLGEQLAGPYVLQTPAFPEDSEAGRVLACLRTVSAHIETWGAEGLGSLIVSMTRDVSDLLAVYFLARHAGLCVRGPGGLACVLPVIPLFETFDDLVRAPAMVADFLDNPVTQATLAQAPLPEGPLPEGWFPRSITVMIGYSDSNKDSGMLAGNWALFKSQREITAAAATRGVRVRYFHGRGGTISRGAGPTHRFLEALPANALAFDLRLTEQGETIAQKYANRDTAVYHLESLLAGVTAVSALQLQGGPAPGHPEDALVELMVEASRKAYRRLWESEGFGAFHRQATPIDALESSRIGSRPARRSGAATLDDLRAIPWVFSWSQSRFFLTGWYGTGSALAQLKASAPDAFERLAKEIKTVPFLRYALANIETSVSSAEPGIMRDYASLVEDTALRERIMGMIEEEYHLTVDMIAELLGHVRESRRPRLEYSLRRRNEGLKPLHAYQIRLLREWRAAGKAGDKAAADAMLPALLVSINSIASGLRTTG